MVVRGVATAAARANHFQEPEMQRVSRQKLPAEHVYNTGARFAAAAAGLGTKALTTATAKKILTTAPVYRREATSFTLDSLIADCRARTLMVRRGDARQWITFTL
jgi:hypothetical protein